MSMLGIIAVGLPDTAGDSTISTTLIPSPP
jgi:hypothetical protein